MSRRRLERAPHFVPEIPYSNRLNLCKILDGDGWDRLAGEVGIDSDSIMLWANQLRHGNSATEKLLQSWSHLNPTIEHLFQHLYNLRLIRAMDCIKQYVPAQMRRDLLGEDVEPRSAMYPGATPMNLGEAAPGVNLQRPVSEHELPLPVFSVPKVPAEKFANFDRADSKMDKWMNATKSSGIGSYFPPNNANNNDVEKNIAKQCGHCSPGERHEPMKHQLQRSHSQGPVEMDEPLKPENRVNLPIEDGQKEKKLTTMSDMSNNNQVSRQSDLKSMGVDFRSDISDSGNLKDTAAKDNTNNENDFAGSNLMVFTPIQIKQATGCFDSRTVIGEGAYGKVYVAEMHGRKFAVKVINKSKLAKDKPTEHHIKEKLTLDKYRHPNIVQLCGFCFDCESPCLVLEYMENGNLSHRITRKGNSPPIAWQLRHSIACDVASALQYLHNAAERPTIHGDIKSPNILLNLHWVAKLSDFGLAQQATSGTVSGHFTEATVAEFANMRYGSFEYIPEEVWESQGHVSTKTDVFSLGVVILELLTGQRPSTPGRRPELLRSHIQKLAKDWTALERLRDPCAVDWPQEFWGSFMRLAVRCTSPSKKKRPEMKELSEELAALNKKIEEKGLALWPLSRPIDLSAIPLDKNMGDVSWAQPDVVHPDVVHPRKSPTHDVSTPFQQLSVSEPTHIPHQTTASSGSYELGCGRGAGPSSSHICDDGEVQQPICGPKLMQLFYEILNEDTAGKNPRETQLKAQHVLRTLGKDDYAVCPDMQELYNRVFRIANPNVGAGETHSEREHPSGGDSCNTEVRDNARNERLYGEAKSHHFCPGNIPVPDLPLFDLPSNQSRFSMAGESPVSSTYCYPNPTHTSPPMQPNNDYSHDFPTPDAAAPDAEISHNGSTDSSKRSSLLSDEPEHSVPHGPDEVSNTHSLEEQVMKAKLKSKSLAIFG